MHIECSKAKHLRKVSLKQKENTGLIFDPDMTSVKPYFIQALHEWISDNGLTPLAVVDASYTGIRVPNGVVEDGKIVLNISYDAAQNLEMDEELLTFNARFSGVSHAIIIPMEAVSAIYARENGKGMMFEVEDEREDEEDQNKIPDSKNESESTEKHKSKPSHLKLVD
jgi:stringent starvation protein B